MLTSNKKGDAPQLYTADEIIALSGFSTVTSIHWAFEIYKKSMESGKDFKDRYGIFLGALANIFDAGRIQGIREERQKRR